MSCSTVTPISPLFGLFISDAATYAKVLHASQPAKAQPPQFLDWRDRPAKLQKYIDIAYEQIVRSAVNWGYKGDDTYNVANVRDYKVIQQIVHDRADEGQKDVYILDVGAGAKFQWVRAVADYLNRQDDIPEQVTIHLIGVTGEATAEPGLTQMGQCQVHCISAFKIEELAKGLQGKGFTQPIDLAFSRWTLTHLQDPAGSLEQILRVMRAGSFLFTDGFRVLFAYEKHDEKPSRLNMVQFLLAGHVSFLKVPKQSTPSDHFIIQRGEAPYQFPYKYVDQGHSLYAQIEATDHVTDTTAFFDAMAEDRASKSPHISGEAQMYSWFQEKGLFQTQLPWRPLETDRLN